MGDSQRTAVVFVVVVLAIAAPLAVGSAVSAAQDGGETTVQDGNETTVQDEGQSVEVERVSVESMTLRNVTATDAVVREVTVRQLGQRENVTLQNVSAQQVTVREATLSNVRIETATLRHDQLITDFGFHYAVDSNVTNESRARLVVENRTLDGVIIENLVVQNASGLNLAPPIPATGDASVDAESADLVVGNATLRSVESVSGSLGAQDGAETTGTTTAADAAPATNATATESA